MSRRRQHDAARVERVPFSTFVTIASRPSETRRRRLVEMIRPTGKMEIFFEKDWTGQIRLKGFGKFGFWRGPTDIQARSRKLASTLTPAWTTLMKTQPRSPSFSSDRRCTLPAGLPG